MATFVTAMLDGREPYDIYRWAEQLFADRDHFAAIEALEYLMDRAPDSELGSARELLARSYYRSLVRAGKRDEAERARLWATALGMDVSGRRTN